jgi:hypothetical protein
MPIHESIAISCRLCGEHRLRIATRVGRLASARSLRECVPGRQGAAGRKSTCREPPLPPIPSKLPQAGLAVSELSAPSSSELNFHVRLRARARWITAMCAKRKYHASVISPVPEPPCSNRPGCICKKPRSAASCNRRSIVEKLLSSVYLTYYLPKIVTLPLSTSW